MRPDFITQHMNDTEIWNGIPELKTKEKTIQAHFIAYLAEIDRRKLFAIEGFSSLFQYVVVHLGYSEASALKRNCLSPLLP